MVRSIATLLVLSLGFCIMAAGCQNQGKQKIVIYEQTPYLALNGAQSQMFSLNVDRLRMLSIYDRVYNSLLNEDNSSTWWHSFTSDVGIYPMAEIDRAVIAWTGKPDMNDPLANAVLICTGEFKDYSQLVDGFLKFMGDRYLINPPEFKKSKYEGVEIYSTKAPSLKNPRNIMELHFAFPSANLMIFSRQRQHMTDCLDVISDAVPGILQNEVWKERMDRVEVGAMAWAVGEYPAAVTDYIRDKTKGKTQLQGLTSVGQANEFYFSLRVSKQYHLEIGLICSSIDQAKDLRTNLSLALDEAPEVMAAQFAQSDPKIPILSELFARVFVNTEFNTAKATLRMWKYEIEEFVHRLTAQPIDAEPVIIPAPFLDQN